MPLPEFICAECKRKKSDGRTTIRIIDYKILRICKDCWKKLDYYSTERDYVKVGKGGAYAFK